MYAKKLTAILTAVIITVMLSACGSGGADIPISRLKFGMSEEDVKAIIKADIDTEYSEPKMPLYIGTTDIAGDIWHCSFLFSDNDKLQEIFLIGGNVSWEECFAARDSLIKNLSISYGVPESDWEIKNDGYSNFLNYKNKDGQLIQLYIRLYDGEQEDTASITMIFKSYDDISVIPKN